MREISKFYVRFSKNNIDLDLKTIVSEKTCSLCMGIRRPLLDFVPSRDYDRIPVGHMIA
jgi:hypothetical protein